jgi:heme/copper-type cytochrome/quinol oxidase subunit 4
VLSTCPRSSPLDQECFAHGILVATVSARGSALSSSRKAPAALSPAWITFISATSPHGSLQQSRTNTRLLQHSQPEAQPELEPPTSKDRNPSKRDLQHGRMRRARLTRKDTLQGPSRSSSRLAMNCSSTSLHLRGLSTDLVALVASFAYDLDSAAAAGHLEVVRLLLRLRRASPVRCSFRALNAAAAGGFLAVVQALHASGVASCSTFAMNMAAAHGHLHVVRFLHLHRSEGCTSYAMDAAAAKGHLDVVRFLHFHRTERCTTAALDLAAAQGHLQVVLFLHRHRTEGGTVPPIDRAAQNGHLRVVQFCREARPEGFTQLAILWASANGHMDVVRYLQPSRGRRSALGTLLGDGRLLVC